MMGPLIAFLAALLLGSGSPPPPAASTAPSAAFANVAATTPEQWGIRGDGSDETAKWLPMLAEARKRGSLRLVLTAGRTYAYTNPYMFAGIRRLRIEGHGAAFRNVRASAKGQASTNALNEALIFPLIFQDTTFDRAIPLPPTRDYGPAIDTVMAGGRTIRIKPGGSTASFRPGERALIYGYATQETGFPNTSRVFEYVRVAAVKGDIITIDAPLRYTYRDDWPTRDTMKDEYKGPARIVSASRPGFQEIERLEIDGLRIADNPAWKEEAGGSESRNGRLSVGGYQDALLTNLVGEGGMYVLQGGHLTDRGSHFAGGVEDDKFIERVDHIGVDYAKLGQGTGVYNVSVVDSVIREVGPLDALQSYTIRNSTLMPSRRRGAAFILGTYGTPRTVIEGNQIHLADTNVSLRSGGGKALPFYRAGAGRIDTPKAPFLASNISRLIAPGSILYDAEGRPVFQVSDYAREAAGRIFIDGKFTGTAFVDGEPLAHPLYADVVATGNRLIGGKGDAIAVTRRAGPTPLMTRSEDRGNQRER